MRAAAASVLALALALVHQAKHSAQASGFMLYEQSAAALGRAAAVAASPRDPSAAWFNPAALAFAPPAGVELNAGAIFATTRFSPAGGGPDAATGTTPHLIPSLFGHVRLSPHLQLGMAALAPFGLQVSWPDDWVGAEQSLATRLRVTQFGASLAGRFGERVAVAAGASALRGTVGLVIALPQAIGGRADLDGSAWAWGWNAAVLVRILSERLHAAATYRSPTELPFRGRADFSPEMPGFEALFADQSVRATLKLPDAATLALMWRPVPRLELAAQVDRVAWSRFDRLVIDFENTTTPDRTLDRSGVDPLTFRAGAELEFPEAALRLRTGVLFDQSSSRKDTLAPAAPDGHRIALGAGAGRTIGRFQIDLAYLFAHFLPATAEGPLARPEGTYRTRAHVLALGLTVR